MNKPKLKIDKYAKKYCLNGKLHREDGPALEYAHGYKEWWYNGIKYDVNSVEELMIAVLLK